MRVLNLLCCVALLSSASLVNAEILPEAQLGIKIPLAKKPTTRPMTVAHIPALKRYYIADGGLAPMGGEGEVATSKSQIHAYDDEGNYINSARPGYDNRSIYYNPNTYKLETITYNISSDVGFSPNSGIFSIDVSETGEVKDTSSDVHGFNPAFGDSATMPSYNPDTNQYYAKQERGNKVWVVETKSREKVSEIALDLKAAGAEFHDVSDHYIAYSGVKGQELVLLDVDHKAVLIFDLSGKYVGRSELPKDLKLRSQNHFNGTGYANNMLFVYHEPEGEFGTYYGFKVLKNN
ncbi:MAG: hypothetical protein B7Y16_00805 [Methylotenera sp. 24-45-7]|nr:MAG: hypothetical protein B7Y16_00805 [Methylotenera sp. 24-45-7]HQS43105.1 hypothetical protein [Methylotenera sp.]